MTTLDLGPGHDPEEVAGRYLGGDLDPAARAAADAHLPACPACWTELAQGRRGRALAESAREVAPAALRERLRASVHDAAGAPPVVPDRATSAPPVPAARRSSTAPAPQARLLALAAALVVVALAGGLLVARGGPVDRSPATPVAAAAADVAAGRLPGTGMPELPAPDLGALALVPSGGAAGTLGGQAVTGYTYADGTGRELVVYLSDSSFPRPGDARDLRGADGPWLAGAEGLTVLCARAPHDLLVLGEDPALVRAAAEALGVV